MPFALGTWVPSGELWQDFTMDPIPERQGTKTSEQDSSLPWEQNQWDTLKGLVRKENLGYGAGLGGGGFGGEVGAPQKCCQAAGAPPASLPQVASLVRVTQTRTEKDCVLLIPIFHD